MLRIKRIKNLLFEKSFLYLITYFIFNILLLTSCTSKNLYKVENKKPFVLTTFTILADLAENVAGERLEVKSITKPGAEIHSYQFTPSDIIKTKGAKLIIENGLGLEAWISKFTMSAGNIPKVKLTEGINPLLIDGDIYAGKPNPHAWMSPEKAIYYVDKIVDAFIEIDPAGSDEYRSNASSYKASI